MKIMQSIWRLLGFGGDDDYDEILDDNVAETPKAEVAAARQSASADEDRTLSENLEFSEQMRVRLFDNVLKVFNEALPDFLRRSIDPEAQHKALMDALDGSIATYLAQLQAESDRRAEHRLRAAGDAAKAESERLMHEMERLEQQKSRIHEQQLSSDRRLRAVQDRARDLEEQVGRLEAEREQLQLEKSSLLNKIKLGQVQPEVIENLQKEIERLRSGAPKPEGVSAEAQQKIDVLDAELAEVRKELAETQELMADTEKELDAARSQLAETAQQLADRTQGVAVTNEMYSATVAELTGEREKHENTRRQLAETEHKLEGAQAELDQATRQIEELTHVAESLDDLTAQMAKVEEVIAKRDDKISRLRSENRKLKEQVTELREANLQDLRDAVKPQEPAQAEMYVADEDESFGMHGVDQLPDDEDFEYPEWFAGDAAPAAPKSKPKSEGDSDFGYAEPPKKPKQPANEAQLSLF